MTRRNGLWLCETDQQFLPLKKDGPFLVGDQMIDKQTNTDNTFEELSNLDAKFTYRPI